MSDREEINGKTNGSTGHRARRKSARPNQIAYVPINEEDLAPYEPPVKKKYKALKITGITAAMVLAAAGAAYAGVSYYYSDKFLREPRSMELTVPGKRHTRQSRRLRKLWKIIP